MTLVKYIVQDLEAQIRQGKSLPERLTLSSLATHYGVSFTPVREAVEELIQRGFLARTETGRLELRTDAPQSQTEVAIAPPVQPVNWEDVLTRYVLLESLRGQAVPLREEAIAQQFAIGRTILRQVFSRLTGAGLIDYLPRRGWRIRPFREQDLHEYLEVRVTLELKALQLAWRSLDRTEIEAMLQGNQPTANADAPRLDNRLHQYFIQTAENRYISDFFSQYGGYYGALFDYAALGDEVIQEMAQQHCAILRAVLDGKLFEAQAALESHIRAQRPAVLRVMQILEATPHLSPPISP